MSATVQCGCGWAYAAASGPSYSALVAERMYKVHRSTGCPEHPEMYDERIVELVEAIAAQLTKLVEAFLSMPADVRADITNTAKAAL